MSGTPDPKDDPDTLVVEIPDEDPANDDPAGEGEGEGAEPKSSEEAVKVASLMGWKPLKDWKGDASNWKPAEAFLAEVPDVLKNTRKKAERLDGQLARIVGQLAKLDKNQRKTADVEARKAAREAFEAGDYDAAEKILTEDRGASEPDEPPALTAFKARNEWFGVDDEATAYTAALDAQYAKAAGGVTDPDAHMRKVEAGVKKRFPELFGEAKDDDPPKGEKERAKPPLVNRGGRTERARHNGELTVADLTPAQRKACVTMDVTPEAYVKQLNKLNKADA